MSGCTNCGNKGGCDSRKHGMMAEVNAALDKLYPTKRWHERSDHLILGAGVSMEEGRRLAQALAAKLNAFAIFKPGEPHEFSDVIYVLCFGRQPCAIEVRESLAGLSDYVAQSPSGNPEGVSELYLRVSLSALAPFAVVQEARMSVTPMADGCVVEEQIRAGVFDPILLPRYKKLVAVLSDVGIRNVDFGDIDEAPEGFDGSHHQEMFGMPATIANYLFFAGPTATLAAELVPLIDVAPSGNDGETLPIIAAEKLLPLI